MAPLPPDAGGGGDRGGAEQDRLRRDSDRAVEEPARRYVSGGVRRVEAVAVGSAGLRPPAPPEDAHVAELTAAAEQLLLAAEIKAEGLRAATMPGAARRLRSALAKMRAQGTVPGTAQGTARGSAGGSAGGSAQKSARGGS